MTVTIENETIIHSVQQQSEKYITTSKAIHAKPEIGNEEVFASAQLVALLQEADFDVQTAVAGHETSFYALKDSGKPGPTIAYLAEDETDFYDRLEKLSKA